MRFILLLIIGNIYCIGLLSQPTTLQNIQMPNVATLNKFIDFPVDKSTGIPNISVPIYTLKERGFELPIALAYHAGGIRVEEVASNVGLGWTLLAEPTMSRTVKGLPDESIGGYFSHSGPYEFIPSFSYPPTIGGPGQVISQMESWKDTQPDLFCFKVGDYSGKFVFDTGRHIQLIPQQDIKIDVVGGNYFLFKIITPDGTQYFFSFNYDYSQLYGNGGDDSPTPIAWHADSIITTANTKIEFEYQEDGGIANRKIQHESAVVGYTGCPWIHNAEWRQTNRGFAIKKIKSASCEIIFNYKDTYREDYRPDDAYHVYAIAKALDNIIVKENLVGDTVKKYAISTSYFLANDTSVVANDDYLKKRLRLDGIKEYFATGDSLTGYTFSYNKHNATTSNKLPNQVSTAQDHWGFYNGKSSNVSLYPSFTFYDNSGLNSYTCSGADRSPDSNYKCAYILDEIVFPSGGKTKYIYESCVDAAGLRVKEIYNSAEGNSPELKTSYTYENPAIVGGAPVYQQNIDVEVFDYQDYISCSFWQMTWRAYMVFTNPVNYTGEMSANHTYYGKVTEKKESGGSIESYYDVESLGGEQDLVDVQTFPFVNSQPILLSGKLLKETYKDEAENILKETECLYSTYSKSANNHAYIRYNPFCLDQTRSYGIGTGAAFLIEKKITDYTSDSTYLLKRTAYEYGGVPSLYDLYINHIPVTHHFPTKQIEYLNDTVVTQFKYPLDYTSHGFISNLITKNIVLTPIEKITSVKNGTEKIINGEIMTVKNNTPFVDKTYKLEISTPIALSSYTTSSMSSGGIFSMDEKYKEKMLFNSYDTVGNLAEFNRKSDFKSCYIWDYKLTYPIAQVKNADSSSVAYTSFEADNKGNWSFSGSIDIDGTSPTGKKCYSLTSGSISKSGLSNVTYTVSYWSKNGSYAVNSTSPILTGRTINGWTYYEHEVASTSITISGSGYIDEVRLYPKGSFMSTYTYSPLIGMSSACDINSHITYYLYDNYGRLKLVKDENGNILKKMEYKYQEMQ